MAKPYGQLFWDRIDRYPPILLRLLARIPRSRPLETFEIASRSGLSESTVEAIGQQTDWRGVDIPTARAFMTGVGIDLSDRSDCRRIRVYLKSAPKTPANRFPYLKRSEKWESYFLPLLKKFVNHLYVRS
jgi:hypothetical protein